MLKELKSQRKDGEEGGVSHVLATEKGAARDKVVSGGQEPEPPPSVGTLGRGQP